MTFDEKKEFLCSYRDAVNNIKWLQKERQNWDDIAHKITQTITPVQGGGGVSDRVGSAAAEIAVIDAEITAEIERAQQQREMVKAAIGTITNRRHRTILNMIYLSGMSQFSVSCALGKTERNIQDLHRRAVDRLDI